MNRVLPDLRVRSVPNLVKPETIGSGVGLYNLKTNEPNPTQPDIHRKIQKKTLPNLAYIAHCSSLFPLTSFLSFSLEP